MEDWAGIHWNLEEKKMEVLVSLYNLYQISLVPLHQFNEGKSKQYENRQHKWV